MRRLLVIGAGGHGQVVADILLFTGPRDGVRLLGFLDDDEGLCGRTVLGLPVLGPLAQLAKTEHDGIVLAIGHNPTRQRLALDLAQRGEHLVNAIHPGATIACEVALGCGLVICAGAIVGTGSRIGDGAILNTASSVDHHNQIGAFAHVAPGAHLGGNVTVGDGALVGIGSTVIPGRTIGAWSMVGAGSAVVTDIPPHCVAVGIPARPIKMRPPSEETR